MTISKIDFEWIAKIRPKPNAVIALTVMQLAFYLGPGLGAGATHVRRWVAMYKQHGEAGLFKREGSFSGEFKLMWINRTKLTPFDHCKKPPSAEVN